MHHLLLAKAKQYINPGDKDEQNCINAFQSKIIEDKGQAYDVLL